MTQNPEVPTADMRSPPMCVTCGTLFTPNELNPVSVPPGCPICEDERQYVGWHGQQWTTIAALAQSHTIRFAEEDGVAMLGLSPGFAINQRAFLIPQPSGDNIMWECVSLVTQDAVTEIAARGGVSAIAISHPHFYSAMVPWSAALGNVPIYLHEDDRRWVQHASEAICFWRGETLALGDDVDLIRLGGHFPGSTALHWRSGPTAGGSLFPGDAVQVVMDRRRAAFMYSFPNMIPLPPADVRRMRDRLAPLDYADVFGFTWGRQIIGGAKAAVDASFERYLDAIADDLTPISCERERSFA
jgi:glyoxylase-like metal-dependent hydrolase (beta-lactamase superfamily II)